MPLKLYAVSSYSKCRSYFASYLRSVTVLAGDAEQARELAKQYADGEMLYESGAWDVCLLADDLTKPGVVDSLRDSDY
jgi:hypothetical protein